MVFGILKKVFGGGSDGAPNIVEKEAVDYNGYRIIPMMRKEPQGLRVAGRIELEKDDAVLTHDFVRADVYFSEEDTLPVVIQKAKRLIDEQGERIFAMAPKTVTDKGDEA
jgi:hypothetical protein